MSLTRFMKPMRSALAAATIAGLAVQTTATRASDLIFPVDEAVARFVMPITPYIFDLIVQSTRSVAEISYERRAYDAVTNTLFVKGLHVQRDPVDVKIGRMRLDLGSLALEDFEIDTRGLDLPPPVLDTLKAAGRDKITGDVLIGVKLDGSRSSYEVTMRYDLDGIGAITGQATIDDLHVLVPMADLAYGDVTGANNVSGSLMGATVAYQDKGFMALALKIASERGGGTPDQLKAYLLSLPATVAQQVLSSLGGGGSPEMQQRITGWAKVVEAFIKDEDAIRVTLAPARPIPLQRIAMVNRLDESLINELNPTVTKGFAMPIPAPPAAGSAAEASALVSGVGAPQNREDGARKLMALAASGDVESVRALGVSFGTTAAPALPATEMASFYGYLLVARALDTNVSDAALSAVTAQLTPEAVLGAERAATTFFEQHGASSKGASLEGFDADAYRALAYDYYEGSGVPRNFTRALSLALVASAAGDPFAPDLRDDLTAAAAAKTIVLDAALARVEADLVWKKYVQEQSGRQ
ncbi:MAG: hypothetical protein AB7I52_16370 [Rhizobiaceae bacterium]